MASASWRGRTVTGCDARQTAAVVPPSALAVPASLYASLMARLDRLGPAREVAQIGAAVGREFSHALPSIKRSSAHLKSDVFAKLFEDRLERGLEA